MLTLIAIACTVTFVVTWTISLNMYNDIIPGAVRRDEISAKLQEIDSFVRNNYFREINDEEVAVGMFTGYISGVGDKNTIYMTADEYARHLNDEKGQFISGGIRAEQEASGYIEVIEVYSGSTAESSGIVRGDLVTAIDGIDVLTLDTADALRLLEGEENTRFTLTIRREGEDMEHSLVRRAIDVSSLEAEVINNVGFIKIHTFNELTAAQFKETLEKFAEPETPEEAIRALLIDVRANKSDFYSSVSEMVNGLISSERVAFTEHKGGSHRDFIVTDDSRVLPESLHDLPIMILADLGTSGAGELLAASLKSHAGAQIVGSNSAGDAYLRQTQPLKDGSAVRVTIAQIGLFSDLEYADVGLTPDYAVEMPLEVSYNISELVGLEHAEIIDPQIRKAFEVIETIIN